jgi:hypothetical protein
MQVPKRLKVWIVKQATSERALLRRNLAFRIAGVKDCRALYRVVKRVGIEYNLTPGRWRDSTDRRYTRFTLDKGKPRSRSTIAERR